MIETAFILGLHVRCRFFALLAYSVLIMGTLWTAGEEVVLAVLVKEHKVDLAMLMDIRMDSAVAARWRGGSKKKQLPRTDGLAAKVTRVLESCGALVGRGSAH